MVSIVIDAVSQFSIKVVMKLPQVDSSLLGRKKKNQSMELLTKSGHGRSDL